MDAEKEKRFRFRARYEAEQSAKASPDSTMISDTRDLINTPAEMLRNNPGAQQASVDKAQQKAFGDQGAGDKFLSGVGRFGYGAIPGVGNKDELALYDKASKGDAFAAMGKMAPELAMTMAGGAALSGATGAAGIINPLLRSAAQGAAYAAPSVALHQSQKIAEGKGFDPLSAATEIGFSTAIPVAGNAVSRFLQGAAPGILRSAVKPVLNSMDVPNPPNFQAALENNLVPYLGGLEASQGRARGLVQAVGARRDAAARATQARVPVIRGAFQDARNELTDAMRNPRTQMLTGDYMEAQNAMNYWRREFAARSTARGGRLSIEDAMAFRQRIDDEINWRVANQANSPGFERASSILRRRINEQIERTSPEVGQATREMAQTLPYEQALARRNLQAGNNYRLGLLDIGALGVGGAAGAAGSLGAAPLAALGALGARRLTSTPGGAAMLYDAGRWGSNPSTVRDLMMQLARSGYQQEQQ